MNDQLWFHGSEAEWKGLGLGYWQAVQPSHMAVEREFDQLDVDEVRAMTPRQFYVWLHDKYVYWKYTGANRLTSTRRHLVRYLSTDPELRELAAIHVELFSVDRANIAQALAVANSIHGLGMAGASGLLAVLFPADFGTVDQFVVDALYCVEGLPEHALLQPLHARLFPTRHGLPPKKSTGGIRLKDAALMIHILRRQARDLNARFHTTFWTPRRVDMALWGDR